MQKRGKMCRTYLIQFVLNVLFCPNQFILFLNILLFIIDLKALCNLCNDLKLTKRNQKPLFVCVFCWCSNNKTTKRNQQLLFFWCLLSECVVGGTEWHVMASIRSVMKIKLKKNYILREKTNKNILYYIVQREMGEFS